MKNLNSRVIYNTFMIGTMFALLILAAKYGNDQRRKQEYEQQQHNKKIEQNDAKLHELFQTVDNLQTMAAQRTQDSLAKHPEFIYLEENREHVDSLRNANTELFNRAYSAAQKSSILAVVKKTEKLFTDFSNVPTVNQAKWKYYRNKKTIQDYDKRKNDFEHVPALIQAHFDSATAKQIHQLQSEINSLLLRKDSLLSQKVR